MTSIPAPPTPRDLTDPDSPIVSAASGPAPYRVVVLGAGASSAADRSRLAGAITQRLAERTGHGVDVEATVGDPLADAGTAGVLPGHDLSHEDALVVVADPRSDLARSIEHLRLMVEDLRQRMTVGAAVVVVVPSAKSSGRAPRDLDRFAELARQEVDALTPVVRLEELPGLSNGERVDRWAESIADTAANALIDPLVYSLPNDPFDEFDRVDIVRNVGRRYIDWAGAFEDVVDSARTIYATPSAAMSIIDDETTRYFARSGNVAEELPRGKTVCNRVMRIYGGLIMGDARLDVRFSRLPEVRSGDVRFYAGYRITGPDGAPFGALCVFDSHVRTVDETDLTALRDLALDAQRRLWALLAA